MSTEPEVTNMDILETPKELLSGLDRQRQFLLHGALMYRMACPNCIATPTKVEASMIARGLVNRFKVDEPGEYRCPTCDCPLSWCVPLVGTPYWEKRRDAREAATPKIAARPEALDP
jgi:hypothetical protein